VKNDLIFKKIKKKRLENRVSRPGFFQSKQIATEAVNRSLVLTKSVVAPGSNIFWVNDLNAYDVDHTESLFKNFFPKAFKYDKSWTLKVLKIFEEKVNLKYDLIKLLSSNKWSKSGTEQKIDALEQYVDFLLGVQNYYVIAVPLTNYCENVLKDKNVSFSQYAAQYKRLDIDRMNSSLIQIKKSNGPRRKKLIDQHLRNFAWIKTNYNIVDSYKPEEVLAEIKTPIRSSRKKRIPKSAYRDLVLGMQTGIYLRNRIKEVSQQAWFAYDKLAGVLAEYFRIPKNDFFQLHYREVVNSLKAKKLTVSSREIKSRHSGFIVGYLDNEEVVATGSIVDRVSEYLNQTETVNTDLLHGNSASPGRVVGTVKVVMNISEIHKLQKNDILVTSMTTPDFVVAMKRSGAIVTDEGGLSCHAAIVSRELGVPCVIGTKIATKIFKDGDLVQVDAKKGIVKRLS